MQHPCVCLKNTCSTRLRTHTCTMGLSMMAMARATLLNLVIGGGRAQRALQPANDSTFPAKAQHVSVWPAAVFTRLMRGEELLLSRHTSSKGHRSTYTAPATAATRQNVCKAAISAVSGDEASRTFFEGQQIRKKVGRIAITETCADEDDVSSMSLNWHLRKLCSSIARQQECACAWAKFGS